MSAWIHILKLWKWPWRTENQYSWKHWVFEAITFDILFCRTVYLWIHYLWMLNRRWNLRRGKLVSLKDYEHFCIWCVCTLIHYSQNMFIFADNTGCLVGFNCLYLPKVPIVFYSSWCCYSFFFFFSFCLFRAALATYGGSQARGLIGATASSLLHSHSNTRSEPHLRPTP